MKGIIISCIFCMLLSCSFKSIDSGCFAEVQISPSFGEKSKFVLESNGIRAIIYEDWRLSDSVNVMHEFESTINWESEYFQTITEAFPKNGDVYTSSCTDLDGWRLKGEMAIESNKIFKFDYQDCYRDIVAHRLTQAILELLKKEFTSDTVTSEYLTELEYVYFKGVDLPLDSVEQVNRKLHQLRLKTFKKYY